MTPNDASEVYLSDSEYETYFSELAGLRRTITKHIPLPPSGRVLDLATGYGYFTLEILKACPEVQVVGIDLNAGDVKRAQQLITSHGFRDRAALRVMDAANMYLEPAQFDAVVNFLGLEDIHMTRGRSGVQQTFLAVSTLLKPGGSFCFAALPPDMMETEAQHTEVALFSYICDATWLESSVYTCFLSAAGLELKAVQEFRTGRKLNSKQAKQEIRFACENVPRLYGVETPPFEEVWQHFGSSIERNGLGHYSKVVLFVAGKSP
jgi:cyclopropane fatty-acyl-phospholipid synthase-like methyltransferase